MMKRTYIYCLLLVLTLGAQDLWSAGVQVDAQELPTETVDGKTYYLYTVERSIGLYRISVNFGVTQEELLQANPHLQQQGLRHGEVIRIPAKQAQDTEAQDIETQDTEVITAIPSRKKRVEVSPTPRPTPTPAKERRRQRPTLFDDSQMPREKQIRFLPTPIDTLQALDSTEVDSLAMADTTSIRLAYLLPLYADAIKRDKNIERFYDFYAGALIAIYEAQATGQRLEIYTYDIGKTAQGLQTTIAQHPEIRQVDAIVGPAYSQQVYTLIDSLQNDSIWCLIPFLSHVEGIEREPYVIKFNPSEPITADTVARYLAQRHDSVNCVLIESKEGEEIPSSIAALHKALKQHQVPTSTITLKALLTDSVEGALQAEKENIIVFNTERYANLQTVMPHLLKACGMYRITLFSHYSWQNEKIILPQLYTSVFAPSPIVPEEYEQLYAQYFDHELSSNQPRYDLLGYDLTKHLLQMLMHEQKGDSTLVGNEIYEGIQANIQYIQSSPQSGHENHIVHIIHQ